MRLPETKGQVDPVIGTGALQAHFRPSAGGRMSRLVHETFGEILVPMTEAEFAPFDWPKAGAYPLFPFHNRVIGGLLRHEGRSYRLAPHPALAPDAMHGPAHRRPWSVAAHTPERIVMVLDYSADEDWPFDFRAEQAFHIAGHRLTISLRLSNTGSVSMPGGLGWHPYFKANLLRNAKTDARATYPLDALNVPSGARAVARLPGPLPDKPGYTIHLTEWQSAHLETDGGAQVTLKAPAGGLDHLAVHRMPDYLCFEPVSHRAGGLEDDGGPPDGLIPLAPATRLEARAVLEVTPPLP